MVTVVYPLETLATPTTGKFFCDCNPDCIQSIILPTDLVTMLMDDNHLILIVEGHASVRAGEVVAEGEGYRVHRQKEA